MNRAIEELRKELWNPWFWAYLFSIIASTLIYNFTSNDVHLTYANITSLFILAAIQLTYGYFELNSKNSETRFQQLYSISIGVLFLIVALMNLFTKIGQPIIALFILFAVSGVAMTLATIGVFRKLWKSDTLSGIILLYFLVVLALNYLFAFGYSLTLGFPEHTVIDSSRTSLEGLGNVLSYSYLVFYTSVQGEESRGYSRLLTIIQVSLSYLLHTILIGIIVQRWMKKKSPRRFFRNP